jgi:hypothetical protein
MVNPFTRTRRQWILATNPMAKPGIGSTGMQPNPFESSRNEAWPSCIFALLYPLMVDSAMATCFILPRRLPRGTKSLSRSNLCHPAPNGRCRMTHYPMDEFRGIQSSCIPSLLLRLAYEFTTLQYIHSFTRTRTQLQWGTPRSEIARPKDPRKNIKCRHLPAMRMKRMRTKCSCKTPVSHCATSNAIKSRLEQVILPSLRLALLSVVFVVLASRISTSSAGKTKRIYAVPAANKIQQTDS